MILLAINEGKTKIDKDIVSKVVNLLEWQLKVRREVDPIDAEGSIARMEEGIRRALSNGPLGKRELQRKVNYQRAGIFVWTSAMNNLEKMQEVSFNNRNKIYQLRI